MSREPSSVAGAGPESKWSRWLRWLLTIDGSILCLAFLAVFLPTRWMEATTAALGLTVLPDVALTQYLTRSLSLLYGVHGVLFLLAAKDPHRLAPLIKTLAVLDLVLAAALAAIDVKAGMPTAWTVTEAVGPAANGLLLLYLLRRAESEQPSSAGKDI